MLFSIYWKWSRHFSVSWNDFWAPLINFPHRVMPIMALKTSASYRTRQDSSPAPSFVWCLSASLWKGKALWCCLGGSPRVAHTLSPGCSSASFPSTFLTIFTRWALPVVAAGAKCHRTLIWDFWMWLVRGIIPPASVMRWHHVVMNLLTEHRHCSEENTGGCWGAFIVIPTPLGTPFFWPEAK